MTNTGNHRVWTPTRIERVRLFSVTQPLVHEFETSSHSKSTITHILVELTDADGVVGWGEIATPEDPYYCSEYRASSWEFATNYVAPRVVGSRVESALQGEGLWAKLRGNEFSKSGFSIALWDLFARRAGVPLSQLIGGYRESVEAGVSLGIEPSIDALVEQVGTHVAAGYRRVKLKVSREWLEEPVRAVREAYPNVTVHVDFNAVLTASDDDIHALLKLDSYGLAMIEQPFAAREFVAHARVAERLDTPICLDESIVSVSDIYTMRALRAGSVVNLKVSRMGGIGPVVTAHDVCRSEGITVWCGGMHEFGVGRAANLAVCSLAGFDYPSDVSGSDKYYENDIVSPAIKAVHGVVALPTSPGSGYTVDSAEIENRANAIFELRA